MCKYDTCKHFNNGCPRAMTQKEIDRAIKWWGGDDYPLCVYMEKPDCYEDANGIKDY